MSWSWILPCKLDLRRTCRRIACYQAPSVYSTSWFSDWRTIRPIVCSLASPHRSWTSRRTSRRIVSGWKPSRADRNRNLRNPCWDLPILRTQEQIHVLHRILSIAIWQFLCFSARDIYSTYSNFAHGTVIVRVRRDDNVNVLDDTLEGLIQILAVELKLQQRAIHLVHEQNGLDTLSDCLAQYGFGLYTYTWK